VPALPGAKWPPNHSGGVPHGATAAFFKAIAEILEARHRSSAPYRDQALGCKEEFNPLRPFNLRVAAAAPLLAAVMRAAESQL
jgi:hypothetical protein